MSQIVIERIGNLARAESADINRSVLKGIVPAAQRTFAVITPQRQQAFSKMFFSRQHTPDADMPERWNIYGRFLWFLAGIYFANQRRGEMLIDHFMSVVEWLRQARKQECGIIICRDFWQIDEDTSCLRAARHSAKAAGNERRVLELTGQIAANEREILESQQRVLAYAKTEAS